MNADLSREVGRIMGKANPAPVPQQRARIINALETADSISDLPVDIQELLKDMKLSVGR